jgi:hypothetical protein
MKFSAGQQKNVAKLRQQRKTENFQNDPQLHGRGRGKPKLHSQGNPDGPGNRLAILAAG